MKFLTRNFHKACFLGMNLRLPQKDTRDAMVSRAISASLRTILLYLSNLEDLAIDWGNGMSLKNTTPRVSGAISASLSAHRGLGSGALSLPWAAAGASLMAAAGGPAVGGGRPSGGRSAPWVCGALFPLGFNLLPWGVIFGCLGRKIEGDSWFTWWFCHLPGSSICPKRTPMLVALWG